MVVETGCYREETGKKSPKTKAPTSAKEVGAFIERLKECMGDQSLESFGALAGLSKSTIWQYLKGESEPKMSNILALAKAAGVRPEWLLTGAPPKRQDANEPEVNDTVISYDVGIIRPRDEALLRNVLISIEKAIEAKKAKITAERKAEITLLLYELYLLNNSQSIEELEERCLRLVS